MNDYAGELGEFSLGYCMPDELVDLFFDPPDEYDCGILLKSEMPSEKHFDGCINAVHYG